MSKRITTVYRSPREEGLYLYVDKTEGLARVPEALLQRFGKPEVAMTLALDPQRKLARADVSQVLRALDDKGFYLQLPPLTEFTFT